METKDRIPTLEELALQRDNFNYPKIQENRIVKNNHTEVVGVLAKVLSIGFILLRDLIMFILSSKELDSRKKKAFIFLLIILYLL